MSTRSSFAVLALLLSSTPTIADECDARAADLVRETGATFLRRSSAKIFLKPEGFKDLAVNCWPSLGVDVSVNVGLPPDAFFDFVGRSGRIVTGLPTVAVKDGAILCHKSALRSGDKMSDLDYQGAQFSCEASTQSDVTSITVFKMR
jgi:hypothetical protein